VRSKDYLAVHGESPESESELGSENEQGEDEEDDLKGRADSLVSS